LTTRAWGALDLTGSGSTVSVDLRALLNNLDPQPSAGPQSKSRPGDRKQR
jgi:hypothetical protein